MKQRRSFIRKEFLSELKKFIENASAIWTRGQVYDSVKIE
jgi:hypothetical protein